MPERAVPAPSPPPIPFPSHSARTCSHRSAQPPCPTPSNAAFARFAEVEEYVEDRRRRKIPTIDAIIKVAAAQPAEYVVLTNWDIGIGTDFYVSACAMLTATPDVPAAFEFTRLEIPLGVDDPMATIPTALRKLRPASADDLPPGILDAAEPAAVPELLSRNKALGAKHPGHDCFVYPKRLTPPCFVQGLGFLLAYPPWGEVLKIALRGSVAAAGGVFKKIQATPMGEA